MHAVVFSKRQLTYSLCTHGEYEFLGEKESFPPHVCYFPSLIGETSPKMVITFFNMLTMTVSLLLYLANLILYQCSIFGLITFFNMLTMTVSLLLYLANLILYQCSIFGLKNGIDFE